MSIKTWAEARKVPVDIEAVLESNRARKRTARLAYLCIDESVKIAGRIYDIKPVRRTFGSSAKRVTWVNQIPASDELTVDILGREKEWSPSNSDSIKYDDPIYELHIATDGLASALYATLERFEPIRVHDPEAHRDGYEPAIDGEVLSVADAIYSHMLNQQSIQ
jgi:hypothetical protein